MPPRIWMMFMTLYLRRPEAEALAWWRAVERADWSLVQAFHHTILDFEAEPDPALEAVEAFMVEVMTPAAVVGMLEALVHEGLCTRRATTQLEEEILDKVTASGQWSRE